MKLIGATLLMLVLTGPAVAAPKNIEELSEAVAFLGATAGIAEVCSQDPRIGTDEALWWSKRASRLGNINMAYAARVAPSNEAAEIMAELGFAQAAAEQHKNLQRVWDDPKGCGPKMKGEINGIILDWSRYLQ